MANYAVITAPTKAVVLTGTQARGIVTADSTVRITKVTTILMKDKAACHTNNISENRPNQPALIGSVFFLKQKTQTCICYGI